MIFAYMVKAKGIPLERGGGTIGRGDWEPGAREHFLGAAAALSFRSLFALFRSWGKGLLALLQAGQQLPQGHRGAEAEARNSAREGWARNRLALNHVGLSFFGVPRLSMTL